MTLFENFFRESRDLCCICSRDKFFIELSPSWVNQLGWSLEELKSKPILDFIHIDDRERVAEQSEKGLGEQTKKYLDCRFLHKNGNYRWLSWSFTLSVADNLFYAIARDITDLRKNNLSLEALMASLDDLVLLIDEDGLFIDLWTSNSQILFVPREKILGQKIRDVFGYHGVGFESVLNQSLRLNRPLSMEFQLPGRDGWFSAKVTPILKSTGDKKMASFLIRDISDRVEADRALDQERGRLLAASKMATLGEMAAGIAHEINNPLAIIQGKAWLLKKHVEDNKIETLHFSKNLQIIHDTSDRISKIIHGLKTFARNADGDPFSPVSLAQIIDDTLELCREKFKNNGVQLRVVGKRPYQIECRGVQISQVVLNLISNSFDAVVGTEEPWVALEIEELPDKIEISITDSGKGIGQALQEKIMQPFFTTKEVGKGTGLGLSINKGIVESHGGEFYYDRNSPNTRFVVRLPKKQKSEKVSA